MAADRKADRHAEGSRHQITLPAALWKRLGQVVGDGNRSLRIRQLVEADLAGEVAPSWPGRLGVQPAATPKRGRAAAKEPVPAVFSDEELPENVIRLPNGKLILRAAPPNRP